MPANIGIGILMSDIVNLFLGLNSFNMAEKVATATIIKGKKKKERKKKEREKE
jgi:hypothetical protein